MTPRLDHSNFFESTFRSLSLADGNMTNGSFIASTFQNAMLDRVSLSGANLRDCNFIAVSMINCSLSGTILNQAKFSDVNLMGCTGLTDQQISVISNLHKTILPNGTFVNGTRN